ncbi:MAG: GlsB/YeaQ/YmgE family stress response membrane protein [Blastocatellia bacterium]
MWIISTLIVGLIAGALARLIMPGRDPMGIMMTIVLGIVGSFVGGFLYRLIFNPRDDGGYFQPGGLLLSVLGAILVLFIWRMLSRRT